MCKHIWKTWTFYLQDKNDFVDTFQVWLPQVKAESGYLIKVF